MEVYIKDMKMPKSCWSCDIPSRALKCPVQTEEEAMRYCSCRHKDCPIVSVLPHGKLIDGDAIVRKIKSICGMHWTVVEIERAPTIIPASEEGET